MTYFAENTAMLKDEEISSVKNVKYVRYNRKYKKFEKTCIIFRPYLMLMCMKKFLHIISEEMHMANSKIFPPLKGDNS